MSPDQIVNRWKYPLMEMHQLANCYGALGRFLSVYNLDILQGLCWQNLMIFKGFSFLCSSMQLHIWIIETKGRSKKWKGFLLYLVFSNLRVNVTIFFPSGSKWVQFVSLFFFFRSVGSIINKCLLPSLPTHTIYDWLNYES